MLPDFKEERTRKFTTLVLTIIALSFFGLFAINPTLSTIANLQKQLSDDKDVDRQLQDKINSLYALQERYAVIKPDLHYVLDSVPQNPQAPLLLADIQSLGNDSSVVFSNLQTLEVEVPSDLKTQKKYYSFSFSLSANGGYDNLSNFIDSLSNMQRIVSLNTLTLTKGSGDEQGWKINLKGTAYFKQ